MSTDKPKEAPRPWMLGESYDLRAENDRLRAAYQNLLGQVIQARDGFGTYRDSPSMAKAIEEGEAYFFGGNNGAVPRAPIGEIKT